MKRTANQRIAQFNFVAICSFAALLLLFFTWAGVSDVFDDRANQECAERERSLGLTGQSKEFLLANFGPPAYTSASGDLFVYTPGPPWVFWRSECKVGINSLTGQVDGWMINSD